MLSTEFRSVVYIVTYSRLVLTTAETLVGLPLGPTYLLTDKEPPSPRCLARQTNVKNNECV